MEKVKEILAAFIGKSPGEITPPTIIDKTVVPGSILIHRMYAALALQGYVLKNYTGIKTYGELLAIINNEPETGILTDAPEIAVLPVETAGDIGVDLETLANMPVAEDYREDAFYTMNFTQREISYCTLKTNPRQSFLGLFCAKEALCKVSPRLAKMPFNEIEISHSSAGRPLFDGFLISISHTGDTAVAVAVKETKPVEIPVMFPPVTDPGSVAAIVPAGSNSPKITLLIAIFAFILSALALALVFFVRK